MRITEDWVMERAIDLFPETVGVLYGIGFSDLETPVMRHAAKLITIKQAAHLMGADLERLITDLNEAIQ
jgi:hypothetical protein